MNNDTKVVNTKTIYRIDLETDNGSWEVQQIFKESKKHPGKLINPLSKGFITVEKLQETVAYRNENFDFKYRLLKVIRTETIEVLNAS